MAGESEISGTNKDSLQGERSTSTIPEIWKRINIIKAVIFVHVNNGMINGVHIHLDNFGMLTQLDLMASTMQKQM